MAAITVTNTSGKELWLRDFYTSLAPGQSKTVYRTPAELGDMRGLQRYIDEGLVSVAITLASYEIVSELVSVWPLGLNWRPTVATLVALNALPTSKNRLGDTRLVTGTLETYVWDGATWVSLRNPTGPAGGDLSGTYPNPTVSGIQGVPIENAAPANGEAMLFNSATNQWEHAPITFGGGPPTGPAAGDLAGLYPDPLVDGLQGRPVSAAVPAATNVLAWSGAAWSPTDIGTLVSALQPVFGSFSDSTSQPVPTGATALAVQFDTVERNNGVVVTNNLAAKPTRITVSQSGLYAFDISPQLLNTGGSGSTVHFWARVNEVDVPRSASSLEMGNNNNRTLPFLSILLAMTAGQYLEWMFNATGPNTSLQAFPAAGIIPANPSIIVNVRRLGS